jgi:hypothetical protein
METYIPLKNSLFYPAGSAYFLQYLQKRFMDRADKADKADKAV